MPQPNYLHILAEEQGVEFDGDPFVDVLLERGVSELGTAMVMARFVGAAYQQEAFDLFGVTRQAVLKDMKQWQGKVGVDSCDELVIKVLADEAIENPAETLRSYGVPSDYVHFPHLRLEALTDKHLEIAKETVEIMVEIPDADVLDPIYPEGILEVTQLALGRTAPIIRNVIADPTTRKGLHALIRSGALAGSKAGTFDSLEAVTIHMLRPKEEATLQLIMDDPLANNPVIAQDKGTTSKALERKKQKLHTAHGVRSRTALVVERARVCGERPQLTIRDDSAASQDAEANMVMAVVLEDGMVE